MARVLVIEANEELRESLAAVCETWGHDVAQAGEGRGALGLVSAFRPDVVLLDMTLSGIEGQEVARSIRVVDGWRTFIVAFTGWSWPPDRAKALSAGANVSFLKPPDLDALQRTIEDASERLARRRGF
jgi:CheY-like chemotaxis protein